MNTYTILTPVESVHGSQTWTVEATSEKEAIEKYNNGEGELEHEEIEVMDLGKPVIIDTQPSQCDL